MGTPARVPLLAVAALFFALAFLQTNAGLVGTQPSGPLGKEFITACLKNHNKPGPTRFEVFVTAYHDSTSVSITLNKSNFRKQFNVRKGETLIIPISKHLEMLGVDVYASTVIISSNKVISVLALNSREDSSNTIVVLPISELGKEYYLVTPSSGPAGQSKELFVANYEQPNTVDIQLKGAVTFKGQNYKAGSTLSVNLQPYEVIQVLSRDDMSGTRIVSTKIMAVASGHTCAGQENLCNHVSEQLLPVSRWGTTFVVPPLNVPGQSDTVYVTASKDTNLEYQLGASKKTQKMGAGEVFQIQMSGDNTLFMSASVGIQVDYYNSGGKEGERSLSPYLVSIPSVQNYGTSYKALGLPNFQNNIAVLIAKTTSASGVTVDQKRPSNLQWKPVPGCDYSWAIYDFGAGFSCHTVDLADIPFGLLSIGYRDGSAYGFSGIRISAHRVAVPQLPPSRSTQPSGPLGLEFITSFLQNNQKAEAITIEILITAYFSSTIVSINSKKSKFKKEFVLEQGQTISIPLPKALELQKSNTFDSSVIIKADKVISVMSKNYKGASGAITVISPLNELGKEYYVIMPQWGPEGEYKEFSITNDKDTNKVNIYLTGAVKFEGKNHMAGSILTVTLEPYRVLQLQSRDDLSGTRIVSTSLVAVVSGHSCSGQENECSHVSQQLLPVSHWQTRFLVPVMCSEGQTGVVYVSASKNTRLEYEMAGRKNTNNLKAGQVLQIETTGSNILDFKASDGVQIFSFMKGGKIGQQVFYPIFMRIPGISTYGTSYKILGHEKFDTNVAVFIAKTSSTSKITFDGQPLSNVVWKAIPGSDYSWAHLDYGSGFSCHTVDLPQSAFCLLSIGYGDNRVYGTDAIRISALQVIQTPEEMPISVHPSSPVGKDFIIIIPKNVYHNKLIKFLFTINAYFDATTVTITLVIGNIKKEITLGKGQTETITIPITAEMLKSVTSASPVIITSDKPVSVACTIYIDSRVQTIEPVPLQQQGVEYYVLTPPGKSDDDNKEFSIANFQEPNNVDIYPTETVDFQGKTYKPGSKITTPLKPFEVIQLKSKDNLSGTRVSATNPIAVTSGYSSPETVTPSYQVSTQLHPVSRWGREYLFPSLAHPGSTDMVFVVASQPSQVEYQVDDRKQSQKVKAGEVIQIGIPESSTVSITSDFPVQMIYYRTGGKTYEPSFINIPDKRQYRPIYEINVNPTFEKTIAIITMKTSEVPKITIDGKPLSKIEWKPIPGTEYSTAKYDLGIEPGTHIMEAPDSPFGLIILGYPKQPTTEKPGTPTDGEQPTAAVGKEFVFPSPESLNQKGVKLEFRVTAYEDQTQVSIVYDLMKFSRKFTLSKRQTATVSLTVPAQLLATGKGTSVVIKSDKPISVATETFTDTQAESSEIIPLQNMGSEYYVVTPPGGSEGDRKEFSITNYEGRNNVKIYPTGTVEYQGKTYTRGSTITVDLESSQQVVMQSKDDLSGSRVVATKPVAVSSGYSCSGTGPVCHHVSLQLRPTSQWGKQYFVPNLAFPGSTDMVLIVASQDTQLSYRVGESPLTKSLKAGEAFQIKVAQSVSVSITASAVVMVTYYCSGGHVGDVSYSPFLLAIPDVRHYGTRYTFNGNPLVENIAVLIGQTAAVSQITFDGKSLSNISWNPFPGTAYSWAKYDFGTDAASHTVGHDSIPFGLIIMGYNKGNPK